MMGRMRLTRESGNRETPETVEIHRLTRLCRLCRLCRLSVSMAPPGCKGRQSGTAVRQDWTYRAGGIG